MDNLQRWQIYKFTTEQKAIVSKLIPTSLPLTNHERVGSHIVDSHSGLSQKCKARTLRTFYCYVGYKRKPNEADYRIFFKGFLHYYFLQ